MRAIQIRCPNCGATLDVQATALTITCSYCQTQSRVRPRTRFLEAPVNLPKQPQLANLPIAVQQHSRRWAVSFSIGMFVFVAMMALIPMFVVNKVRQAATGHNGVTGRTLSWSSDSPLAADVNGDGADDLLGRLRGLDGNDSIHLVAFDGKTGARLWQSPGLGTYSETYQGAVVLLGPQLLFVNARGLARGFDVKTGAEAWKVNILEKLESACADGDTYYLRTADERWIKLDHTTGKASEVTEPARCKLLMTDDDREVPRGMSQIDVFDQTAPYPREIEGMSVRRHLIVEGNERLAIGYKSPGTQVPMVARYRVDNYEPPAEDKLADENEGMSNKRKRQLRRERRRLEDRMRKLADAATFEIVWKIEVPANDPLGASTSAIEHVGLSREADCLVVPYAMQGDKPIRVSCLSWKTGAHKWDVAMPKAFIDRIEGLTVSGQRAFFAMSSRVHALDLTGGSIVFTAGQTN